VNVFQEPSKPPQFGQYGQIRLRYDTLSKDSSPDVLGHREVAYLRLLLDLSALFFGKPGIHIMCAGDHGAGLLA
jgi:hypothetical protein